MELDKSILVDLFKVKMPFGKHKGLFIGDLPSYYLEWFSSKGFPKGRLGVLMATAFEIRTNGLEEILDNLRQELK